MSLTIDKPTIMKFDVPGPRYTSYPTAPVWSDEVNADVYAEKLKAFGQTDKTLSLYIHIPFCQTMCTYCGCNVVIRRQDDQYGDIYLEHLFKEIDLVAGHIGRKARIKQFHWGGGTPTYLNEDQIGKLFEKTVSVFDLDWESEIAIEIDPRTVDASKVLKLKALGFNRISFGVQDFDLKVQEAVNRVQPFKTVKEYYDLCRSLGFGSINFDLIYGLPYQSVASFNDTVKKVIALKPDRIALYSFAYVPWLKRHQRKIESGSLPANDVKLDIFLNARDHFLRAGYQAIAMDHFALKGDELAAAFDQGSLYRNFMGYTVKPADEYIGVGLTSIGFLENTFIHNIKALPQYYEALDRGKLPVERGKVLNADDLKRQWTIGSLMCRFVVDKEAFKARFGVAFDDYFFDEQQHLQKCLDDRLIAFEGARITVTDLGKIFIRNVCMGFDFYLKQNEEAMRFSRTV